MEDQRSSPSMPEVTPVQEADVTAATTAKVDGSSGSAMETLDKQPTNIVGGKDKATKEGDKKNEEKNDEPMAESEEEPSRKRALSETGQDDGKASNGAARAEEAPAVATKLEEGEPPKQRPRLNPKHEEDEKVEAPKAPLSTNTSSALGGESSESKDQTLSVSTATAVSYLLEEGKIGPDGNVLPTTLRMTLSNPGEPHIKQEIRLQEGDDVILYQDDEEEEEEEEEKDPDGQVKKWPPARVQRVYERGDKVYFAAQWFLSKQDIALLPRTVPWTGVLTRKKLLDQMDENDIVLSDSTDENEIGAIIGLARVKITNEPEQDGDESTTDDGTPVYNCRYQLLVSPDELRLVHYTDVPSATASTTGDEDTAMASGTAATSKAGSAMEEDDDDNDDEDSGAKRGDEEEDDKSDDASVVAHAPMTAEGEGSTLRESIEVGAEHQAVVPPFNPKDKNKIESRNPTLVWKPGVFSDKQVGEFLEGVAKKHTPFLDKNHLSNTATYTPVLGSERLEKLLKHRPERLTGSSLSTASMLAGEEHRAELRKECDADTLLEIMMESKGSVQDAIDIAVDDLDRITRAWSFSEKSVFNDGFRRHQGVLRKIAKTVAPVKSMTDVVDYHFRFKIPDHFRQYQEKKREIAVRIVECLEEKRAWQPPTNLPTPLEPEPARIENGRGEAAPSLPPPHWSETSVQDIATMTDARRRKARELMLNVQEEMGPVVLAQVAQFVRQLNQSYSQDVRKKLLGTLAGHSDLQQRFIDFLPK